MHDRSLLTLDELATASGVTAHVVRQWVELGLISGDGTRFPVETFERIRLIQYAERRGLSADDVAAACRAQGDVIGDFVALITEGAPRLGHAIDDVAERTGLEPEAMRRLWVASGLGDQIEAFDEDLEAQRWMALALADGIPEDALMQLIRVYADATGRIADAESRLFHFYVHERLRAEGLRGEELSSAIKGITDSIGDLIEPALLYFHRKAFQRALREDFILHLTEATSPPGRTAGEMQATILFVDLAGFTPLDRPGPAHCGWSAARVLVTGRPVGNRYTTPDDELSFVRDPNGVFGEPGLTAGFEADAQLPADATDTGFHSEGAELWTTPGDDSAVFLKTRGRVERWPQGEPPLCR